MHVTFLIECSACILPVKLFYHQTNGLRFAVAYDCRKCY